MQMYTELAQFLFSPNSTTFSNNNKKCKTNRLYPLYSSIETLGAGCKPAPAGDQLLRSSFINLICLLTHPYAKYLVARVITFSIAEVILAVISTIPIILSISPLSVSNFAFTAFTDLLRF